MNINKKKPAKILIVDDDEGVRGTSTFLLQTQYDVVQTDSGEAALEAFKTNSFDLVIVDYTMPGMNGDELARKIAAMHPELPIIMFTGYAPGPPGPQNPVKAIVQKPDITKLCRMVAEILER